MNYRIIHILIILLITGSSSGQSLDEYLVMAAENNPGLKAKFLRYQAALERIPQAGALPDPQVSYSFFLQPMERYSGNQTGSISLMQMFPWLGTLEAAREEMAFMAKAEFEAFNEARLMLFYEIRTTWYAMQQLNHEISITTENIELLKTIEQISLSRFKSGSQRGNSTSGAGEMTGSQGQLSGSRSAGMGGMKMQPQTSLANPTRQGNMTSMAEMNNMTEGGNMTDVLRVQLELNELRNILASLQDAEIPLRVRFNLLLNRQKDAAIVLPDSVAAAQIPVPHAQIPDSIRNNNPMLKMLSYEEDAYAAQAIMNRKMGLPMLGLGLQYDLFKPGENSQAMMNGSNMLMPMVSVTIPVWRKKYRAAVKESELGQQSVMEQKQELFNQLMVSYEDALKEFRDADRRVKLYHEQSSVANQALNLLLVQYSTEGASIEEVLRMQRQLLDYRLQHNNAIIDGNLSVVTIERLTGRL